MTRIGNIGFSKIVDWDYEFSIYGILAVIKRSEHFVSYYLHSLFQSDFYQCEIRSKSLLNAVSCKINMDELRKPKVLLPPNKQKKEQKKIADCLSALDERIIEEAEKTEALKLHKKGLMPGVVSGSGLNDDFCDGMNTIEKLITARQKIIYIIVQTHYDY